MGRDGLHVWSRRAPRELRTETSVIIVDRNTIAADVIAWRLSDPRHRVIWIRRGLLAPLQASIQAGFLAFADLVIAPGDLGGANDAFHELSAQRGKLRTVGICHAYQVVVPSRAHADRKVFLSLGAFEPSQRAVYCRVRDALENADIPFIWSAYNDTPIDLGFLPHARAAIGNSLRAKSQCWGTVSEAGYNSLHEALHLARPALFISNDENGREQQSRRVEAATKLTRLAFDASSPGAIEAWIASIHTQPIWSNHEAAHGPFIDGFGQIARIVEDYCADTPVHHH
jgi:hypothetical protein